MKQTTSRRIQKVPLLLLKEKKNTEDYIPKVVSIGPYHHGTLDLSLAESFKPMALEMVVSGGKEREDFYFGEIKKEIIRIRNCYEQYSTDMYSNCELARMMLLDACFIITHMETMVPPVGKSDHELVKRHEKYASSMLQHLGMLTMMILLRDLLLIENQIPFWIVKLLIKARYDEVESEQLLNRYLNMILFGELRKKRSSSPENEEELHLLEAFHRLLVHDCVNEQNNTVADPDVERGISREPNSSLSKFPPCVHQVTPNMRDAKRDIKKYIHSFRSVTHLKAKGICFKPSNTSLSLKDVKFKTNFIFGQLELPTCCVTIYTKVFFLNVIAYELSPNNPNNCVVTSYINLMKTLIESPEDVKELQEKKIFFNMLGSDKQVLKVFKEIETYGANNALIFHDVKEKIQAHYNSKVKTWIAELIHTHFRTPWTVIALLAAMALLALASIQVIYASEGKSD